MNDRLKIAYATAMAAQHTGARVELHLGSSVVAYLKALCEVVDPASDATRCWGFPVLEMTGPGARLHISVHVVTVIA